MKKEKLPPGYYDPRDYTLVHNRHLETLKLIAARHDGGRNCVWTEDDEGIWDTACGEKWVFTEGYPWDNKARFCFACGCPIEAKRYSEEQLTDPAVGQRSENPT